MSFIQTFCTSPLWSGWRSQLLREQTQTLIQPRALPGAQLPWTTNATCCIQLNVSICRWNFRGFWHLVLQKGKMCFPAAALHNYPGRVMDKSTVESNSFNTLSLQISGQRAHCSSADLCVKSPVGAVMEGGAHSTAYCLTATVSIWLRAHSRLFLP